MNIEEIKEHAEYEWANEPDIQDDFEDFEDFLSHCENSEHLQLSEVIYHTVHPF